MVLDFLRLIHVSSLHFEFFQPLHFLLETLVLVGHHMQKDHNLLGLRLLLLQLLLSLLEVISETFSFSAMSMFKLHRICNLVVLYLNQFPQILILLLQRLCLVLHCVPISLRLQQTSFIWLVLFAQLCDLLLSLVHKLILSGHNWRDGLFAGNQLRTLFFGDSLVFGQFALQFGNLRLELLWDTQHGVCFCQLRLRCCQLFVKWFYYLFVLWCWVDALHESIQTPIQRLLLFLKLLGQSFVLNKLFFQIGAFLPSICQISWLLPHSFHLSHKAFESVSFGSNSGPGELSFDQSDELFVLVFEIFKMGSDLDYLDLVIPSCLPNFFA